EVLTRASLVEKETDVAGEYATIAGVINNRLDQKMKLQFDSTVVYGMTEGRYGVDRVKYSHLEDDSAYNTYKIPALPPGPICNPGMEAIQGVLYPEDHNYLYFMMDTRKNDGSNLFFETYEEHMDAYSTMTHGEETKETEGSTAP
ncbi:MAG: endolytic transglycosylase MltG, partial [Eubacterium sp.]|nr:endolytic transglycosylase MltG [Eubacterium sp.]